MAAGINHSNRHKADGLELCRLLANEYLFLVSTCRSQNSKESAYGALRPDWGQVLPTAHYKLIEVRLLQPHTTQPNYMICQSLTSVRTPRMLPPPVFIMAAALAEQSARSAQRRAQRGAIGRTIVPPFLRRGGKVARWAKRRAAPLLVLFHGRSLIFFSMAKDGQNYCHSSFAFVPRER